MSKNDEQALGPAPAQAEPYYNSWKEAEEKLIQEEFARVAAEARCTELEQQLTDLRCELAKANNRVGGCLECGEQWDGCYCADDAEPLDMNDSNDWESKP
jgi:hypothetical protein